jgi:hypothetical protein
MERIGELLAAMGAKRDAAIRIATDSWGQELLANVGLGSREALEHALSAQYERIRKTFEDVEFQVQQLSKSADIAKATAQNEYRVVEAMRLIRRILGIPEQAKHAAEADDRGSGHPMRRLAESGVLPGYEFPSEPATLRLAGDDHEDEPITVNRRFGLAQYQPDATAYARGHRWEVVGLDPASPWNPRSDTAQWVYTKCNTCGSRFDAQNPKCPRCDTVPKGGQHEGWEFAGFLARRADTPVLEEEDRFALASLLKTYAQHDGRVIRRARTPNDWLLELRREEEIRWVNEWKPPSKAEVDRGAPTLHDEARGFYICNSCGKLLTFVTLDQKATKKPRKANTEDPYGHWPNCAMAGRPPTPRAITTKLKATTLRLSLDLPNGLEDADYLTWGHSLGASLRRGLRNLYALDGAEVEYELEPWFETTRDGLPVKQGSLLFIDGAVGGSGFLDLALKQFNIVAKRAFDFLQHPDCDSSCYRCLKSYDNQRFHQYLSWPRVVGDLEVLAADAPGQLPVDQDPLKAWREAYTAGVGSPLELKFLQLFKRHGIEVDAQVPIGPRGAGKAISVADFVVRGTAIAVYVDGATFHVGERLRRDIKIRQQLAEGGQWRVVTLRAADLQTPTEVIKRLKP